MKSSDSKPFACERQSHLYYEDAERVNKDRIADRNARTRIDEQLRKERVNEAFWRKVFISANTFAVMLILYTLFHFA